MINRANIRAFVSLLVLMSFAVILVTSIIMFTQKHTTTTALIHTIVGFGLLAVVLFHIKNNFHPIKQYTRLKKSKPQGGSSINTPLYVTFVIVTSIVSLSYLQFQPFLSLYHWGNTLRLEDSGHEMRQMHYQIIDKTFAFSAEASSSNGSSNNGSSNNDSSIDGSSSNGSSNDGSSSNGSSNDGSSSNGSSNDGSSTKGQMTIDFRAGRAFSWPQLALWIESMEGDFIQPLWVTNSVAKKGFVARINKKDDGIVFTSHPLDGADDQFEALFDFDDSKTEADAIIRPESLPVFLHQIGENLKNRTFAAKPDEYIADAYSGATMGSHFLLNTNPRKKLPAQFKVRLEVNQSFDFNAYYASDRFPDDPIYSGNGFNAQPSLIYEVVIDSSLAQKIYPMKLLGHGHHSGKNGDIYPDVSNHTTALEIVDRVIVEFD